MKNKKFANSLLLITSLLLVILPLLAILNGDLFRNADTALGKKNDSNIIMLLMGLILTYYSVNQVRK